MLKLLEMEGVARLRRSLRIVANVDDLGDFEYVVEFKSGKAKSVIKGSKRTREMLRSISEVLESKGLAIIPPPAGTRTWFYVTPDDYLGHADDHTRTQPLTLGYDVLGRPMGLSIDDLFRHVGIFGSTGSGKTTTAAVISREAALSGLRVVILDWHGEYRDVLLAQGVTARYMSLNSLPRVSLMPKELPIEVAVDILSTALDLTEHQAAALQVVLTMMKKEINAQRENGAGKQFMGNDRSILEVSGKSLEILLSLVRDSWERLAEIYGTTLHYGAKGEREIWSSLYRRLYSVAISEYSHLFKVVGSSVSELLSDAAITILDLSSIKSPRIRRLYSLLLLKSLVDEAMECKKFAEIVVVVEEAHNVLGTGAYKYATTSLGSMVAESRKYGVGFIIVTQSPSSLPQQVLSNLNTVIIHRLPSPRDVKLLIHDHGARDRYLLHIVRCLQPGEAVVCTQSRPYCTLVRVHAKGAGLPERVAAPQYVSTDLSHCD